MPFLWLYRGKCPKVPIHRFLHVGVRTNPISTAISGNLHTEPSGKGGNPLKIVLYCVFIDIAGESATTGPCTYWCGFVGYIIEKKFNFWFYVLRLAQQLLRACVQACARTYSSLVRTDPYVQTRVYRFVCTDSCVQTRTYRLVRTSLSHRLGAGAAAWFPRGSCGEGRRTFPRYSNAFSFHQGSMF